MTISREYAACQDAECMLRCSTSRLLRLRSNIVCVSPKADSENRSRKVYFRLGFLCQEPFAILILVWDLVGKSSRENQTKINPFDRFSAFAFLGFWGVSSSLATH